MLSLSLGGCGQQEPPALQSDATSGSGNNSRSRKNPVSELFSQLQIQDIFIGLLHCIGSICTNIGFGYGSASLVQVIKLLEPVETLLLAALVQQSLNVLSPQKVASTLTIVAGTYLLLANASIEVNLQSVIFPIGSGICMASRNVLSKTGEKQENQTILLKGMNKFASITITAAVCSLVLAVFVIFLATLQFSTTIIVGRVDSSTIYQNCPADHCLSLPLQHDIHHSALPDVGHLTFPPQRWKTNCKCVDCLHGLLNSHNVSWKSWIGCVGYWSMFL